jgi:general secretion pathway protein A
MSQRLCQYFGLKFNPSGPDLPTDALYKPPRLEPFYFRVSHQVREGGFALITGDSGLGKSVTLRQVCDRLGKARDVVIVPLQQSQGSVRDVYQELGERFEVPLLAHNRWASFQALRQRWALYIEQCAYRPIVVLDEAQSTPTAVLEELKVISSKDFDSKQLLLLLLCGDGRLVERLSKPELLPVGNRVRARLRLEPATGKELRDCLEHVLREAGNEGLMTPELKTVVAEHSMGNYRVMMNTLGELLYAGLQREAKVLDEKLFFDLFTPVQPTRASARGSRRG